MTFEVVPGILEKEQSVLQKKFDTAAKFAPMIQIDIIDNRFSENIVNPRLAFTKNYPTLLELHLMTQNPEDWIDSYQALNVKRAIGHVEHMQSPTSFITKAKEKGTDPFFGIDLHTQVEEYLKDDYPAKGLKGFLIMTVKAGKSGQSFNADMLKKATLLRKKFGDRIDIEIDGGVNTSNIKIAKDAGVNIFAATSAIFTQDPESAYRGMVQQLEKK